MGPLMGPINGPREGTNNTLGNKSMRPIEGLGQALSELPMLVKTASKLGLT